LIDFVESQGNPDSLFELEGNSDEGNQKVVDELNKLAVGEKYQLLKSKDHEKNFVIRLKGPKSVFSVPRVLGFIQKK
jgi:hypothetical protein